MKKHIIAAFIFMLSIANIASAQTVVVPAYAYAPATQVLISEPTYVVQPSYPQGVVLVGAPYGYHGWGYHHYNHGWYGYHDYGHFGWRR